MSLRPLKLVDFEALPQELPASVEPAQEDMVQTAYADGFKDGAARANDATIAQVEHIASALREAISDHQLSLANEHRTLQRGFLGLVKALLETALPPLLAKHYGDIVGAELRAVLDRPNSQGLSVSVAPSDMDAVRPFIPDGIILRSDPLLEQGCTRFETDFASHEIDIDRFIVDLKAALDLEQHDQAAEPIPMGAAQ